MGMLRWPSWILAELRMHYQGLLFVVFSDLKVLCVHFYYRCKLMWNCMTDIQWMFARVAVYNYRPFLLNPGLLEKYQQILRSRKIKVKRYNRYTALLVQQWVFSPPPAPNFSHPSHAEEMKQQKSGFLCSLMYVCNAAAIIQHWTFLYK